MITAETITDEQIRELAEVDDDLAVRRCALVAENESGWNAHNARARCAEILNAREASK